MANPASWRRPPELSVLCRVWAAIPSPHRLGLLQREGPVGEQVQRQKEQRVERRLAAIFAADVAGYSRLMSQDEAGTLRALAAARQIMDGLIVEHGGRIANTAGDSVLAEFPSVVDAVQCASGGSGEACGA